MVPTSAGGIGRFSSVRDDFALQGRRLHAEIIKAANRADDTREGCWYGRVRGIGEVPLAVHEVAMKLHTERLPDCGCRAAEGNRIPRPCYRSYGQCLTLEPSNNL